MAVNLPGSCLMLTMEDSPPVSFILRFLPPAPGATPPVPPPEDGPCEMPPCDPYTDGAEGEIPPEADRFEPPMSICCC